MYAGARIFALPIDNESPPEHQPIPCCAAGSRKKIGSPTLSTIASYCSFVP